MASILCIDDAQIVRDMVQVALEEKGHTVVMASRVRLGMRALRSQSFDLILMDLNLPDIRGESAIQMLRERLNIEVPIIVLSGEIKQETVQILTPLGISGFVAKTEAFAQRLVGEVERVLGPQGTSLQ